jgi:CBS-domain-containing membrane protein
MLAGWFLIRAAVASHRSSLTVDVCRGLVALDRLTDLTTSQQLMREVSTRLHPLVRLRDLHDRAALFAEQPLLPIEVDGVFLGWVRREDLTGLEYDALGELRLGELMIPITYLPTVQPEQTLAEAVALMNRCCLDYIAVVRQRRLLGIVSREDVITWLCDQAEAVDSGEGRSRRAGPRSRQL